MTNKQRLAEPSRSRDASKGWRPLLQGREGRAAARAIAAIARELEPARAPLASADASLASGKAGLAVFFGYLARAGNSEHAARAAMRLQEQSREALASITMDASLYGGFPGVGWALAHLGGLAPQPMPEPLLDEIDEALAGYVARAGWRSDYDLVSGLVGVGVYALERLPSPRAAASLAGVVERLDETARRRSDGIMWHKPPRLLPPHQRKECPRGYDNLGLAHGVPGVIVILAGAWAASVRRRKAGRLLEGAVRWLLTQKLSDSPGARFPAWIAVGQSPRPSRSAWCYGDPGVAAALFWAARQVGEISWERQALEIARGAAERSPAESGVVDATLCHGAAGLGHLYNRLSQATGDRVLRRAAHYWLGRTIAMRHPGRGVGGYSMVRMNLDTKSRRLVADSGLLTGAAGIGLALLAATTSVEPEWDRMLLVSTRHGNSSTRPLVREAKRRE